MVPDEATPLAIRGLHVAGRLGGIEAALPADRRDPIFARGHHPHAKRRLARQGDHRAPTDDDALALGPQDQEQLEEAPEVGHLGDGRRGGEGLHAFHEPVAPSLVDVLQLIHVHVQFSREPIQDLVVVDRPVQSPPDLTRDPAPPEPASRLRAMVKEGGGDGSGCRG